MANSTVKINIPPHSQSDFPYAQTTTSINNKSESTSINIDKVNEQESSNNNQQESKMSQASSGSSCCKDFFNVLIGILIALRAILCAFIPSSWYTKTKSVVGKNIVITGGGFGLGRLMAQKFAQRGGQVVVLDINQQHMDETVRLINESNDSLLGGKAHSYYCDVSDRSSVYSVAKQIENDVGPVDILIMNAGIVNGGTILNLKDEAIIRCFNINTLSHFWLIKAFLPSMMERNNGHIVSIDSVASYYGTYNLSDYSASKAASHKLQESIDFELRYSGYTGIKLTSIMPYFMNTGMFAGSKSKYFSILEPEYVANQTVNAILTGKTSVFIPWAFHVLRGLTYLVPYKAYFYIHKAIFGGEMMTTFTGRIGQQNNISVNKEEEKLIKNEEKSGKLFNSSLDENSFANLDDETNKENSYNNNKVVQNVNVN